MKSCIALITLFLVVMNTAAAETSAFAKPDPLLQRIVDDIAAAALKEFAAKKLTSNQLAVTLVNLRDSQQPLMANFRGEAPIYPASVVKLFYLAGTHRWMEDGKLKDGEELRRAMRDMIVESSNDATHHVLDVLTD